MKNQNTFQLSRQQISLERKKDFFSSAAKDLKMREERSGGYSATLQRKLLRQRKRGCVRGKERKREKMEKTERRKDRAGNSNKE